MRGFTRALLLAAILAISLAGPAGALPRVLVLGHGGDGPGVVSLLVDPTRFDSVTYQNGLLGTPTIDFLLGFDSVLVYTDDAPLFPDTLGDVLASFADSGGRVVVATYGFSAPFGVTGTIMDSSYAPLTQDTNGAVTGSFVVVSGGENNTIFDNVTASGVSFSHNSNYAHPILDTTATLLAKDGNTSSSIAMLAISANHNVVSINIFPNPATLSGEAVKLFANALNPDSGGVPYTTVQAGSWSDGATWDVGTPPLDSLFAEALVLHEVSVTTTGETAASLTVDSGANFSLTVSAGSLSPGPIAIGKTVSSSMNVSGGTVTAASITIGSGAQGALNVSGGSVSSSGAISVTSGTLAVMGNTGSIDASASATAMSIADGGTLALRPSAAGGLSTILSNGITLGTASTLLLDTSSYTPVVGDRWTVIDFTSGTRTGAFGALTVTPPLSSGLIARVVYDNANHIQLRISDPLAIPALGPLGLALLAGLLVLGAIGVLADRSSPNQRPVSATRR